MDEHVLCGAECQRFFAKVQQAANGCWTWTAGLDNGYGRFRSGKRLVKAHRYSYTHLVGAVPNGLQLDHLCRNRACVRPDHLEPVTSRENILRGDAPAITRARHSGKTECLRGHPYDELNTYARPDGHRACRTCARDRRRARNAVPTSANHFERTPARCPTAPRSE